jgi:hypothetical protein
MRKAKIEEVLSMAKKLPKAVEWQARELKDWNAVTFRAYMSHLHSEKFHVPYITNNIAAESKNIKRMYEEFGRDVVKAFIDECFNQYRPSPQYPNLSFFFMYSYMRERVLPQALKKQQAARKAETQQITNDEAEAWF